VNALFLLRSAGEAGDIARELVRARPRSENHPRWPAPSEGWRSPRSAAQSHRRHGAARQGRKEANRAERYRGAEQPSVRRETVCGGHEPPPSPLHSKRVRSITYSSRMKHKSGAAGIQASTPDLAGDGPRAHPGCGRPGWVSPWGLGSGPGPGGGWPWTWRCGCGSRRWGRSWP
jgi:hypothetical protein